jgi:3-oxoacyl-[acyl-carrier protein] reductase
MVAAARPGTSRTGTERRSTEGTAMDLGLDGKTAIVTGASAGLGLACARELVEEGANVAICARSADGVAAAVEELRGLGGRGQVEGRALDVLDFPAAGAWVDAVAERFGGVDVLIANAGGPPPGSATQVTLAQHRTAIETNLLASVNLTEAALPHLRRRPWGRVLYIASISAKEPVPGLALSNTARAGLLGFAKSLATDVAAEGITVNVLAPGYTRTARLEDAVGDADAIRRLAEGAIPMRRVGEPEEFAAAAIFLASARASFISGTVLQIDGGSTSSLF